MEKCYKFSVLLGSILIYSVAGFSLIFGNVSPYMYSLFLNRPQGLSGDLNPAWMYPIFLTFLGIGTLILDFVKRKCGLRLTALISISCYSLAYFVAYFTVRHSVLATSLLFLPLVGTGGGFCEMITFYYVACWYSDRLGLATALVHSASSVGSILLIPLVTMYINPDGYTPDSAEGPVTYFSQPEVLEKVAMVFIVLGCIFLSFQLIGFFLLKEPPKKANQRDIIVDNENMPMESNSHSPNFTRSSYTNEAQSSPDERHDECVGGRGRYESNNGTNLSHSKQVSTSPVEMMKSESFYIVTYALIAQQLCLVIAINYNKLFGQTWIKDDAFLASVNSGAALTSAILRCACGHMVDCLGEKNALIAHASVCSVLMSLWYFSAMLSKWIFLISTCLLMATAANSFILFPLVVFKIFGKTHLGTNLGLVRIASLVTYLAIPPVLSLILFSLGWFWLFAISASTSLTVVVIIILRM